MNSVGKTLLLDLVGCDGRALMDVRVLFGLLHDLPKTLGMKILSAPQIFKCMPPLCATHADWGFTGMVLIVESHISLHTWPVTGKMNIDITSCKDFDVAAVVDRVNTLFCPVARHTHIVARY
jgi:S-adenosylmethionine decarboxylase